jgi:hypothetical protein
MREATNEKEDEKCREASGKRSWHGHSAQKSVHDHALLALPTEALIVRLAKDLVRFCRWYARWDGERSLSGKKTNARCYSITGKLRPFQQNSMLPLYEETIV